MRPNALTGERVLGVFLAALFSLPLFADSAAFSVTSQPTTVRKEGLSEVIGAVQLTINNPGASTTIKANTGLVLTYTTPITSASSAKANLTCVIGGVTNGAACNNVNIQTPCNATNVCSGNSVFLSFTSDVTLTTAGDGFQVSQLRVNATGVPSPGTIFASISGSAPSGSQPTFTSQQLVVGTAQQSISTASFTAGGNAMYTCAPPGTGSYPATFGFTVVEASPAAFSTLSQETGYTPSPAPSSGTILEVILSNVPAGMTIVPTDTNGSSPSVSLSLPSAFTQTTNGAPVSFKFPFVNTNNTLQETVNINFAAGFANLIDPATILGPITAKIRFGPVPASTASGTALPIVSIADNTLVVGSNPISLISCVVTAQNSPLKLSAKAGTKAQFGVGTYLAEQSSKLLPYTVAVSTQSGGSWLIASQTSGTLPDFLSAIPDATNLTAGTYNGQFIVSAAGATPAVIPVILTVTSNPPVINLSAGPLAFTGIVGSANPTSQTLSISNTGGTPFNWVVTTTTTDGGAWLTATPGTGSGQGTISVNVNLLNLKAGNYSGTVKVDVAGASNTPAIVQVSLVVTSPPTISVAQSNIFFSTTTGVTPPPQTIQVTNSGGGTLGINTSVASNGGWLAVAPASGTAPMSLVISANSASLTPGNYTGTITLTATPASTGVTNSPQTINVSISVGTPSINSGGVVGGASYVANAPVTAGSVASLFGVRLAASSADVTQFPLPTILAGTQVLVNGVPVPLFHVDPNQINFQMPVEAIGSTVNIVVNSGGLQSLQATVPTGAPSPGIFTINQKGTGQASALNPDFTINSPFNPVAGGSVIALYVTGLGAVNPAVATGQAGATTPPLNQTTVTPVVLIGGVSANVGFSGLAPGFVGLYQINATVPQGTPSGNANVQVIMSGVQSNVVQIVVK